MLFNLFVNRGKNLIFLLLFLLSISTSTRGVSYYRRPNSGNARNKYGNKVGKGKFFITNNQGKTNNKVIAGLLTLGASSILGVIIYLIYRKLNENKIISETLHDYKENSFREFRYGGKKEKDWNDSLSNFPDNIPPINLNDYRLNRSLVELTISPEKRRKGKYMLGDIDLTYQNSSKILIELTQGLSDKDNFPMFYKRDKQHKQDVINVFQDFHEHVNNYLKKIQAKHTRNNLKRNLIRAISKVKELKDVSEIVGHITSLLTIGKECETTVYDYLEEHAVKLDLDMNKPLTLPGYVYLLIQREMEAFVEQLIPRFLAQMWLKFCRKPKDGKMLYVLHYYQDYWRSKIKTYIKSKNTKITDDEINKHLISDHSGKVVVSGNNKLLKGESWKKTLINTIVHDINTNAGGRHVVAGFKKEMKRYMDIPRYKKEIHKIGLGIRSDLITDPPNAFLYQSPYFFKNSKNTSYRNNIMSAIVRDQQSNEQVVAEKIPFDEIKNFVEMFDKEFTLKKVYKLVKEDFYSSLHKSGQEGKGAKRNKSGKEARDLIELYTKWLREKGKRGDLVGFDKEALQEDKYKFDDEVIKQMLVLTKIGVKKKKSSSV